ncbi:hypothetical protein L6R52_11620, partial [Myxococcota bacterium]|nr:hypothetical protein [Myxococcota bacterium]
MLSGDQDAAPAGFERLGPFDVVRVLSEAPGATIVEGRDPRGESRLLQVVRCRRATGFDDEAAVDEYVQMVERATGHLASDPDVRVLGHEAVNAPDGQRILYWAMPWRDGAERIGGARELVELPGDLVPIATSLVERLLERHERGRLDPLLSEDLLIIRPSGGAVLAGVPIHLPPDGLADDTKGARFAPEERLRFEPTQTGDVWRLGQALRALSAHLSGVPAALRRIIDALAEDDVALRMVDLDRVLAELRDVEPGLDETAAIPYRGSAGVAGLPQADALRRSYEADRTDPLPLANMRSTSPDAPVGAMRGIADAPTILGLPPAVLRARAAQELERRRGSTPGDDDAAILSGDTIVDRMPEDLRARAQDLVTDAPEEPTIDGRADGLAPPADPSLQLDILDPLDVDPEATLVPGRVMNAWDRP